MKKRQKDKSNWIKEKKRIFIGRTSRARDQPLATTIVFVKKSNHEQAAAGVDRNKRPQKKKAQEEASQAIATRSDAKNVKPLIATSVASGRMPIGQPCSQQPRQRSPARGRQSSSDASEGDLRQDLSGRPQDQQQTSNNKAPEPWSPPGAGRDENTVVP